LNPIISPGTNPNIAAIGSADAATGEGWDANCVAVVLSAWAICSDALVNVLLEASSIAAR